VEENAKLVKYIEANANVGNKAKE